MTDKRKVGSRRPSDDAGEGPATEGASTLENRKVSGAAVRPRDRQQRLVDVLEEHRARADDGEIVGVVIVYVRSDGGWGATRDLATADMRAAIGELELVQHELVEQLVEARAAPPRDRRH